MEGAAAQIAREQKIWLFNAIVPSQIPAYCKAEFTVGDGTLDFSSEEIAGLFSQLLNADG